MNIQEMMQQAQAMQQKLQEAQAKLAEAAIEGQAGGGLVTLTLSGAGELKGVVIDDSLLSPGEGEVLADLLVAAHADARRKAEAAQAKMMQEVAGPLAGALGGIGGGLGGGLGGGSGLPGFSL